MESLRKFSIFQLKARSLFAHNTSNKPTKSISQPTSVNLVQLLSPKDGLTALYRIQNLTDMMAIAMEVVSLLLLIRVFIAPMADPGGGLFGQLPLPKRPWRHVKWRAL